MKFKRQISRLLALVLFLFLGGKLVSASDKEASQCEALALETYAEYRTRLLSSQFENLPILEMLRDNYADSISEGMEDQHFMSLRIIEAKIKKLLAYNATCKGSRIYLKFITENFNKEYSRRSVTLGVAGKQVLIIDTSDDIPDPDSEQDVSYKEVPEYVVGI